MRRPVFYIEGVTQGGPIATIAYGIGILPLINNFKRAIPDITHPWYADDSGALGMFARLETYFYSLTHQGPGRGYYPELSRSFSDHADVPLPRQRTISQPITFVLVVSDVTPKITCARSHLSLVPIWNFHHIGGWCENLITLGLFSSFYFEFRTQIILRILSCT